MKKKTDEELKQIAVDLYDGKIFSDGHFPSPEEARRMIGLVFMPLVLGVFEKVPKKEIEDIGMIYEYYDQAGQGGVNGYPTFMSCRYMDKKDTNKMFEFYKEYKKMKEGFVGSKTESKGG